MALVDENDLIMLFAKNLRKVREQKGFTQEGFANFVGFSRSYYTEIETGKRNISLKNFIRILQALRIDANTLLDFVNFTKQD